MTAGDVAGNRQAEPAVTLVLIARVIEPQERLEHLRPHVRWNARAVVVDGDRQIAMIAMTRDADSFCKPRRIRDQIAEAALERGRPDGDHRRAVERDRRAVPFSLEVGA